MWNRRKEDETPRPNSSMSMPVTPAAPAEPMTPATPANFDRTPRTTAMIGENVYITGQISAKEDLIIDGQLEGTIEAMEHKLTIGKNGKVKATIRAREVVIQGMVHGNVEASDKIDLRRDAHLVGDIRAARIAIEDGAIFKGSIDVTKTEAPKPAVTTASAAPKAAAAAAAGASSSAPQQQTLASVADSKS